MELYRGFIATALKHAIVRNAAWYCWHASRRQMMVESVWNEFGAFVHQQIVWAKSRPVLTHSVYLWSHEPCLFGWIKGEKPKLLRAHLGNLGGEFPTTVWEVPNSEVETDAHPTSKPCRLFALPMEMHTERGDISYDPFSGSGSQLVAAEQLGRRCYAIEKSPRSLQWRWNGWRPWALRRRSSTNHEAPAGWDLSQRPACGHCFHCSREGELDRSGNDSTQTHGLVF